MIENLWMRNQYGGRPCGELGSGEQPEHYWCLSTLNRNRTRTGVRAFPSVEGFPTFEPNPGINVIIAERECAICWEKRSVFVNHGADETEHAEARVFEIVMAGMVHDGQPFDALVLDA